MQYSTRELIRLIGEGKAGAPEPGDIYIVNDPYLGGTHLMDVRFALPFYYQRRALLLAAEHGALAATSAAWCRAASRPTPPRWSRRGCGCRR